MTEEFVILVDKHDREIGQEEKLAAHITGKLHRAFSLFIFNKKKELLLQQRALSKYHSPGLWTNSCCGHPRPGEVTIKGAQRRLFEEFGVSCDLYHAGVFTYRAQLRQPDLIEHEFDHVFYGFFDGMPNPNPHEIKDMRWVGYNDMLQELCIEPTKFSAWFKQALTIAYQSAY